MELKDIYGLWDRFESSSATKMELDYQGVHFQLEKGNHGEVLKSGCAVSAVPTVNAEEAKAGKDGVAELGQTKNDLAECRKELKAPLVGIFYRAAAPGEKPYVEPGQKISKGDVIGIIEAMKVMNEITAKEDGIVDEVLAEDATLVEFNQTLLTFH